MRAILGAAMAFAVTLNMTAGAAVAKEQSVVVVELFTSQGCSSCPPADELLTEMAKHDNLLPLAYHVDYWDYIGWKDTFARPEFTDRQEGYRLAARARYKYTPQVIVGGVSHAVGNRPMEVFDALDKHRALMGQVMLSVVNGTELRAQSVTHKSAPAPMVALLVQFKPMEVVKITRGENAGKEIGYANIVTSLTAIGSWDGEGEFAVNLPDLGTDAAAIVLQSMTSEGYPGAVQAALRLQ